MPWDEATRPLRAGAVRSRSGRVGPATHMLCRDDARPYGRSMRAPLAVPLLTGLATAALALGAAPSAHPATVVIEDGRLRPATVVIPPGEQVVWKNRGERSHRVASLTGSWPTFTVAPGAARSVPFRRAGRFPYRLDGRRRGLVLVGARVRAIPPPPAGTRIHRYDVTATVRARYRELQPRDPDPRLVGSQDVVLAWVHRFPKLRVRVLAVAGLVQVVSLPASERGTVRPRLSFQETRTLLSGPCRGRVVFPAYRSRLFIHGASALRGIRARFDAGAQIASVTLAGDVYDRTLAAQRTACRGTATDPPVGPRGAATFPRWILGDITSAHGVLLREPGNPFSTLTTNLQRRGGGRLPFPVDHLAAGRSFTVDSGIRLDVASCGEGCSAHGEGRIRWVFRRR